MSPEYRVWKAMKNRCLYPANRYYHAYGGRGITICEAWRESFENFLADVGRRPSPNHSIDRIDNDGNYEPGNVRWSTATEQARNRRGNHFVTFNGTTQCIADWARVIGIARSLMHWRLQNWPIERALMIPFGSHSPEPPAPEPIELVVAPVK